jgi:hypothetical protein
MAATDDDLQQVCEGPRDWYLDDDDDLRKAFSAEQIEFATTGKADYMRYGTGGHKYEEGALAVGDGAPLDALVHRVVAGDALDATPLRDALSPGRPAVLDFGSFS